jgi:hypothetical protein
MIQKRKPITINGTQYWYGNTSYSSGEYGAYYHPRTSFFLEPTIETQQKMFVFFGPLETVYENKGEPVFSININIEDPKHSKEAVKALIDAELAIVKRKEEISNGQLI